MVWTIIIVVFIFSLFKFYSAYLKDADDLQYESLSEKFNVVTEMINEAAFDGNGEVIVLDKREYNLYKEGANQIIKFQYGTGHLTITWRYKYFQKEVTHEKQFGYVRNISVFDQQRIAMQMIKEMSAIVINHKANILRGI